MGPSDKPVSRREFARRAALGAASASFMPLGGLGPNTIASSGDAVPQTTPGSPTLTSQGQLEAEARWKAIVEQYSDRFTEAQKADLKRLCIFVQPSLDRLRAYPIANATMPGLYLKPLVERDKKPAAAPKSSKATGAGKP